MKVGIVTLYDSLNYGAYLQAYALQKFVKNMGHEVEFLNISTFYHKKIIYRSLINKRTKALIFNFKKFRSFKQSFSKLRVADIFYLKSKTYYDAVIIGSDEIWNLINPTFDHLPIFFGNEINTKNIITYAPSCGNSTLKHISNDINASKGLKKINSFSARDENTLEIIEKLTEKKPTLVLDPTLLLGDFEEDEKYIEKKGYILVYTYGFNDKKIENAKVLAKKKNLKLVSAGFYNKWCDENLSGSPFEFLTLIKNADYVITDTFHGTLFSIIYKKQFGVFAKGKIKVESILRQLNLENRILYEDKEIESTINDQINYKKVYDILEVKRRQSTEYLINALNWNKGELRK